MCIIPGTTERPILGNRWNQNMRGAPPRAESGSAFSPPSRSASRAPNSDDGSTFHHRRQRRPTYRPKQAGRCGKGPRYEGVYSGGTGETRLRFVRGKKRRERAHQRRHERYEGESGLTSSAGAHPGVARRDGWASKLACTRASQVVAGRRYADGSPTSARLRRTDRFLFHDGIRLNQTRIIGTEILAEGWGVAGSWTFSRRTKRCARSWYEITDGWPGRRWIHRRTRREKSVHPHLPPEVRPTKGDKRESGPPATFVIAGEGAQLT